MSQVITDRDAGAPHKAPTKRQLKLAARLRRRQWRQFVGSLESPEPCYQWLADGEALQGEIGPVLELGPENPGSEFSVFVTAEPLPARVAEVFRKRYRSPRVAAADARRVSSAMARVARRAARRMHP